MSKSSVVDEESDLNNSKVFKETSSKKISFPYHLKATLSFRGLPIYRKDNEYIESQYRPEVQSFYSCFQSMLHLHTETVNIWSHLIAAIIIFKFGIWLIFYPTPLFHWFDKFMLLFYCCGVILGLSMSWLYHTFECHSESVNAVFCKMDYLGICLIIISVFLPYIYFAFYCAIYFKIIYSFGLLTCSVTVAILVIQDGFENGSFRQFRTTLFTLIVIFGLLPFIHYFLVQGVWRIFHFSTGGWMIIAVMLASLGAIFYVTTFPECVYPGMFDLFFQSHQIMHVLIAASLFVHCIGIKDFAQQVKLCRLCAVGCK